MEPLKKRSRRRKWLLIIATVLIALIVVLSFFVNRIVEPVLRDRLHALIIKGSDSLYNYQLGNLRANLFGGSVEVENLQIDINDARYRQLAAVHALPALTMQLHLVKGRIRGLSVLSLLLNRQINVREIYSKDADLRLLRHVRPDDAPENTQPLWKTMQPVISSMAIGRIHLDGVKLLYRHADTAQSVKLQFNKCVALFEDIRVDSVAAADTGRIVFANAIDMQFYGLQFLSPDSSYNLGADAISYSSRTRDFEISNFQMQPTLPDTAAFYAAAQSQQSMYKLRFDKARFTNLYLDRFFHRNILVADTLFIDGPDVNIFKDRSYPPLFESKIGTYPHQRLLRASSTIMLRGMVVRNARIHYSERGEKTGQTGTLSFSDLYLRAGNITNDSNLIKQSPYCVVAARGTMFNSSPINVQFRFYLNASDGRFDATGEVGHITAAQLNKVAVPLANTRLQSFDVQQLRFAVQGSDFEATSDVQMRYNNLFVVLNKTDDETGIIKTNKLLTKILNKFTLHESNPGADGLERTAVGVKRLRVTSQPFFSLLWKSIYSGMQNVMVKSGRVE